MGTRRAWLVLLMAFLPTVARGDDHWAETMGAVSYAHLSDLTGVHGSFAVSIDHVTPPAIAKVARHWSAVADFSAHIWGKHDNEDLNQYTVGLGLRRALVRLAYRKSVPFVQGTIGAALSHGSILDGNRGALALGGGVDFVAGRTNSSGQPKGIGKALRFQGDLVFPWSGEVNWYPRLSVGVVIRINET